MSEIPPGQPKYVPSSANARTARHLSIARIRSAALGMSCHACHQDRESDLSPMLLIQLRALPSGSWIAKTRKISNLVSESLAMWGQLTSIPTDTLIDRLYIILAGDAITASDAAEVEHIQRELQRRGEPQHWMLANAN